MPQRSRRLNHQDQANRSERATGNHEAGNSLHVPGVFPPRRLSPQFPRQLTQSNSRSRIGRQQKEEGMEKAVKVMGSTTTRVNSTIEASHPSPHNLPGVTDTYAHLTSACRPTIKRLRLLLAADAGRYALLIKQ